MGSMGEEIELENPHDPLSILPQHGVDGDGEHDIAAAAASRGRISYFSSPLSQDPSSSLRRASPPSRRRVPLVKITNTSRANINGKFGRVQSYYRARERYAVTLLGGAGRHPALVYFGVAEAGGTKHKKNGADRGPPDGGPRPPRRHGGDRTLFLPSTTLTPLTDLDRASLWCQYVALHLLGRPHLARRIEHAMELIQSKVLPALRLENFVVFFLLLLPFALATCYAWATRVTFYNPVALHLLGVPWPIRWRLDGMIAPLSNAVDLFFAHTGEICTTALLLAGTSTIARFVLFEYRLVSAKAEAVRACRPAGAAARAGFQVFSAAEMFRYRIDYHFSKSRWAKVILLLSFTFMLIAVGAGLLIAFMEDRSVSNAVWIAWTYVADPGTHADCPEAFLIRLVAFAITLGGMLIFALMIGIISDYIAERVDDLKKGKSRIIDIHHTVILGWNDKSLSIIQQVALANESEGGGTIVVLADKDKEELEAIIASAVASNESALRLLGTEVIVRSGNPLLESELRRVSIQTARSIVSLSQEDLDPDEADATQVRQVMALKAFDESLGSHCYAVVEVQDIDNKELFDLVAPDFAEVVVTHDIIGRLMIQCARCPGLASVLEEMMGFEGSEFYFEEWPELSNLSFYDIVCRFDDAVPIGIKSSSNGKVYINPKNDHLIKEGDKILVLAEDNDSYEVNGGLKATHVRDVPKLLADARKVEKIMFCGWRRDMADMIIQLDEYVEKGSELWLFNMVPAKQRVTLLKDKGNKEDLKLKNLEIFNVVGNPVIRRDLKWIRAVDNSDKETGESITLDQFDSILILADAVAIDNGANMTSCDSRSLSSLLIIQDIQKKLYQESVKKLGEQGTPVPCDPISEILDSRTKSLLSVANCTGYVMSNQIISSVMAQVSEEKDINIVLREILTADGSETYIRPVSRYIDLTKERELSFWDISLRARQHREVVVGFKPEHLDFKQAAHLIINPPDKSANRTWAPGDVIVTFGLE